MTDLLYGRNAVREALRAGRQIMRLLVAEGGAPNLGRPAERSGPPGRGGAPTGRGTPGKGVSGAPPRPGRGAAARGGAKGTPPHSRDHRTLDAGPTRPERRVVMMAGRAPLDEIVALATGKGVTVDRVPSIRLDEMTNGANHQGVAAVAAEFNYTNWPILLERVRNAGPRALLLILDSLQDPQNFGTLLRTAEAIGVTGVVMPEHRAVGVTPAVCNASSGAVEWLRVSRVANLSRVVEDLKDANVWVYALAGDDPEARPYARADLTGPVALVVGSEGHGVGTLLRRRCDGALALPMRGRIESLNAAVAGSVVLYEVLRQREAAGELVADTPASDIEAADIEAADMEAADS
jgi:23S rRNA (guanosine2251-2'-O)-methyltransferase